MEFTAAQKRAAFYQAADYIEKNPEKYDFWQIRVGGIGCPACMWGHVGRILGFSDDDLVVTKVAPALGFEHGDLTCEIDPFILKKYGRFTRFDKPEGAPIYLREFADKHWPKSHKKAIAHEPCGKSFSELMASLQSATA